ncbi:ChrR family anti-sigma-E factor [Asticcacaulis sp. EMRT-3]|uniref:ChrR family anti-sigma-E factor n=1 Tax=Asticcacaulis sp. EMRT-3 TaxID=3040349 RepID=UPI0024AFF423|nr:ChrR family anti-sigma-E factor [Asticcacaulis sp. EMRT-3]MDI7775855.1 ChrR family anti-sigma-E factor [Asticcacaulis sp. EMRT-3]
MSSVRHHPGEDVLWDYHCGRLSGGQALIMRAHTETCAQCRADLRLLDAVGGAMLETADEVAMSENALDLALARIERPVEAETETMPALPRRPAFLQGFELPESLRDVVVKKRYWAAPGVWMAPVEAGDSSKTAKTFLMHVKKGMTMPEHTHRGREMTLVLKGRFSDALGQYEVGDLTVCDEVVHHSPSIQEDCLCLVTLEASILPLTWLGRLIQPISRV